MGGVFQLFQEGVGISRNWVTRPLFDPYGWPWNVMARVGVSVNLLMCYSERILRLKV